MYVYVCVAVVLLERWDVGCGEGGYTCMDMWNGAKPLDTLPLLNMVTMFVADTER